MTPKDAAIAIQESSEACNDIKNKADGEHKDRVVAIRKRCQHDWIEKAGGKALCGGC